VFTPQRAKLALDNISFEVKENQTIGVVGPTGSGKVSLCCAAVCLIVVCACVRACVFACVGACV